MPIVDDLSGNTADSDAHIDSIDQAADAAVTAALLLKAPLASPAFTGTPTTPTASPGTNTTQTASTAFATTADALKADKTEVWRVLAKSAVAINLTGTLTQTDMVTVNLPANTLGPNGQLRVSILASCNNNANTKVIYLKLGTATYLAVNLASAASIEIQRRISNRNSANSQVSFATTTSSFNSLTTAVTTSTIDTAAAQTITLIGLLTDIADNITYESYLIEYIYGA